MKFTKIDNIPSASHPNSFSVVNNGNRIDLNLLEWAEPGNGRMTHVAELIINGEDNTEQYLGPSKWVFFGLTKYQFTDAPKRFCFIPTATELVLVDVTTFGRMSFGKISPSFLGNVFYGDKLLVVCLDCLIIVDLKTLKTVKYPFGKEGDGIIEWAYFINPDQVRIIHYHSNECSVFDLKTGKIIETRGIAQEGASAWVVKHYKQENGKNSLQIIWKGAEAGQTASFLVED